ncbi:B3 domain-containing protein [Prunus yedoensis var. nudiflora]|uniref:B3 domain-containing protein n=1 Tax=Prunus yedoensis var. nudiflora TaxID=2094558 RepID=A0A314Y7G4_PRUYE|nr:B3 domain-containing protein [Prunus yedoensis var. nudiflora]
MNITRNTKPHQLLDSLQGQDPKPYCIFHSLLQVSRMEEEEEKPSTELTLAATSSAPQSQCPPEDIVWTTLTLGLPSSTSEKREAVDQNPAPSMKKGPWEIKKRLTTSDLGNWCKLLAKSLVEKHVMPCLDEEFGRRVSS